MNFLATLRSRLSIKSSSSVNQTADIVFVISEYNRGWVLESICKRIAEQWPKSTGFAWTTRNRKFTGEFPPARVFWFSHFQLLLTCQHQFPELHQSKTFVWFTHPSKEEIPREKLVAGLNQCTGVIFACSLHRDELVASGLKPEISHVVLGGADPGKFRPHQRKGKVIGICSAYYPRKSPELLMQVIKSMPDTGFILLAPGPDGMKTKERLWSNWEHFNEMMQLNNLDYIEADYEDYPQHYARMDVLLSASKLEGGPLPLLEAMFCNIVPVASRTGFAPDLIRQGENGYLFRVDDTLDHIIDLLRKAIAHQGDFHPTVTDFTWAGMTKEIYRFSRD